MSKTITIQIVVSEKERKRISELAEKEKRSVSQFCKLKLFENI